MSLYFSDVCELFDTLDRIRTKPLKDNVSAVRTWFDKHKSKIPRQGLEAVAFLSCLFPERRADRVYGLQERRLEGILKGALGLGATCMKALQRWRDADGPDLASVVQSVMSTTDDSPRPQHRITVTEIDRTLDRVASTSSFSSFDLREKIKVSQPQPIHVADELTMIFCRLQSSQAKWMIRLLLKTLSPIQIPEASTL